MSSWETGLEVIEVPRSACSESVSRVTCWRVRQSAMRSLASSPDSDGARVQPTT